MEWEGVHGPSLCGRLSGRVETPNLWVNHRVAQTPKASVPKTHCLKTRWWLCFALSTPPQVLSQDDHDWVITFHYLDFLSISNGIIFLLNTKMTKKAFLFGWKFVIELRKVLFFFFFFEKEWKKGKCFIMGFFYWV